MQICVTSVVLITLHCLVMSKVFADVFAKHNPLNIVIFHTGVIGEFVPHYEILEAI